MKTLLKILKYLIIGLVSIYLITTISGLIVKNQGQSEIDEATLRKDGAKLAVNEEGRKIEYFVYGSTDPSAPVIINMHGSGVEASLEKSMYQPICEELEVRGISISLPGFGNTDMKIGRVVVDWPSEDLEPVLNQEGVQDFMITGHSQGNPHAMAAAYYFGDRCTGLGLYAPLLPNDLFCPAIPLKIMKTTTPKFKDDPVLIKEFGKSLARATIRGAAGNAWESAKDVCYDWGFDPRLIETNNICVWHAADDTWCPPEIGKWLANYFTEKGATVNFKNENVGYGHFTYSTGKYREAEHSLVKALLDGQLMQ